MHPQHKSLSLRRATGSAGAKPIIRLCLRLEIKARAANPLGQVVIEPR